MRNERIQTFRLERHSRLRVCVHVHCVKTNVRKIKQEAKRKKERKTNSRPSISGKENFNLKPPLI